jgi:hypothetical protein
MFVSMSSLCGRSLNFLLDASGVVADEAVTLGSLTVSQQAFGQ